MCQQLAHEKVTILGNQYSFRKYDILGSRYFLDIFGIGPEICPSSIASALYSIGCDILYAHYREAVASQSIAMSTGECIFTLHHAQYRWSYRAKLASISVSKGDTILLVEKELHFLFSDYGWVSAVQTAYCCR